MNVSVSYLAYIHIICESFVNVEWVKITHNNVLVKEGNVTHSYELKKLKSFSVTQ